MAARDDALRVVLPIPDVPKVGLITYDARDPDSAHPPISPLRPPDGAPNVLIVLLDDVGFGASSAFGGPVHMPTAERLAADGLRYTRFHTTAMCAPTRQALLTGRNHHTVGMGDIAELATGAPGYTSIRPNTCATLPETLRLNGYSTAQFGKCHEVPVWEYSAMGPFDRWPTGSGFEHFYGFLGAETNQYSPGLVRGTTHVDPDRTPEEGYHLSEDLADRAIDWCRQQKALMPDKPFFVYFAPGATHAPHHVPTEWSDRYRGKFDQGWDRLREETFARQKELGIVPPDAELTRRPAEIPAWDEMPEALRPVLAREMEVYAGYLEHVDAQVGRLIDVLERGGILDDTLIYYIVGDNGASGEGGPSGTFSEYVTLNAISERIRALMTPEFLIDHIDGFGTPAAYNHYAVGWAHAMDTPYQWTKQVASHWGGTRNGTIVRWPRGFEASGEIRPQFHHVIDIAPTVLEAAGLPEPVVVHGVQQTPYEGVSMAYSFDDAAAPDRHETQYFEMMANRGIYHRGWSAVTRHSIPWGPAAMPAFDDDVWELYGPDDWTQAHDLAAEMPDRLRELQRLFLIEATRHNVLPLEDRRAELLDSDVAGRPTLVKGASQILFNGMGHLGENTVLNLKNKSYTATAEVVVYDGPAEGVIVAQGGTFGGWALYVKDGHLTSCHNSLGIDRWYASSEAALPPGRHQLRMEFAYEGGGLGKGGDVTLYVDGAAVGGVHVEYTEPLSFSVDETLDIGFDSATPVAEDYTARTSRFTGTIDWVQLDQGADDHDHLISPEERLHLAVHRH
jgi:arylsulfatase